MQKLCNKTAIAFVLGALLLSGFAVAPRLINAAPSQPVNPPCEPLSGTFVFTLFTFTGATTAIGQGIVYDGDEPVGTFDANYFNIEKQGDPGHGNGVFQMNSQHTITFVDGSTLMTHDEILLQPLKTNPGWMQANSRLYIVAGTGAYAGATGLVHTHGQANVFTVPPQGSIDFDGQVCLP
jgi:hypothetical protein